VRTVAIDWSGRASNAEKSIWIAEVADDQLVFLENGRGRVEVANVLIEWAAASPNLLIGLDFAFSFPAWFLTERGMSTVQDLWMAAASNGNDWLAACEWPFWGRPGKRKPDLDGRAHFRATEEVVPATAGIRPKSVFQIGGAGAVGTGSIRGMATLHHLSTRGFSIWPFDPPTWPRVIEIYPRLLTGSVRKSSTERREAYLSARGIRAAQGLLDRAASTEDAFDAAVSALVMWEHATELVQLPQATDGITLLEGAIWYA